jgi:hypothetical protein
MACLAYNLHECIESMNLVFQLLYGLGFIFAGGLLCFLGGAMDEEVYGRFYGVPNIHTNADAGPFFFFIGLVCAIYGIAVLFACISSLCNG